MTFELLKFDPPTAQPSADAIEIAEDALKALQSGEAVGIAVVVVKASGTVETAYAGSANYHLLNSGAARLASRLGRQADDA